MLANWWTVVSMGFLNDQKGQSNLPKVKALIATIKQRVHQRNGMTLVTMITLHTPLLPISICVEMTRGMTMLVCF